MGEICIIGLGGWTKFLWCPAEILFKFWADWFYKMEQTVGEW